MTAWHGRCIIWRVELLVTVETGIFVLLDAKSAILLAVGLTGWGSLARLRLLRRGSGTRRHRKTVAAKGARRRAGQETNVAAWKQGVIFAARRPRSASRLATGYISHESDQPSIRRGSRTRSQNYGKLCYVVIRTGKRMAIFVGAKRHERR